MIRPPHIIYRWPRSTRAGNVGLLYGAAFVGRSGVRDARELYRAMRRAGHAPAWIRGRLFCLLVQRSEWCDPATYEEESSWV